MAVEITFQKEFFVNLMPELPELFQKHYEEVALDQDKMKLSPGWKRYIELEAAGVLHILTVRVDGALAGYFFNVVYPHLHYDQVLCAISDMFFVLPQHRQGIVGVKLFTENEKMLHALGVHKVFVMTKVHVDVQPLMKRLKYKFIERIFSKWLQ